MKDEWKIIKLGGSLLSPKALDPIPFDFDYSLRFLKLIDKWQKDGNILKVALIIGGGYLNKVYLDETLKFINKSKLTYLNEFSNDLKDYIGSASIALNEHVLLSIATAFWDKKNVFQDVIKYLQYENLSNIVLSRDIKIIIAGASGPAHSSDANALFIAEYLKSKSIISLKNVDGVYDKDPNKFRNAKYFKHLTWNEYEKVLGNAKYEPRSHFPIDVYATSKAKKMGVEFIIMDGRNLENLDKYLNEKEYKGTIVCD